MGKELLELQLKESVLNCEYLRALLETTIAEPRVPQDVKDGLKSAMEKINWAS